MWYVNSLLILVVTAKTIACTNILSLPEVTCADYLIEFIEDCEFTKLSVRILHLLGIEGPKTSQPVSDKTMNSYFTSHALLTSTRQSISDTSTTAWY